MLRHRAFLATLVLLSAQLIAGCDEPAKVIEPPCSNCAGSEDELIQLLADAYQDLDFTRSVELFPAVADAAPFYFFMNPPLLGVDNWDLTEELRLHRHMFVPEDPLPGELPPPADLWLVSITIDLNRTTPAWVERTDLYKSPSNPDGLDSAKWRASEAEFSATLLFETQGDTDYCSHGTSKFIVIEDRTKFAGSLRKYMIYRWEDLAIVDAQTSTSSAACEPTSWGLMKARYK